MKGWKLPLCRYCSRDKEKGRVKCQYCSGWRNPNRKHNRRARRHSKAEDNAKKGMK